MALTLSQLLAAETQEQILSRLLAGLNREDLPISDWNSGGVTRSLLETDALVFRDLVGNLVPKVVGGGYLDYAEGDWLTLHAKQLYDLDQIEATHTVQNVTLTVQPGSGPYTITAGQLTFRSTAGRRYQNITGGTLQMAGILAGTLVVQVKSESPNDSTNPLTNYIDGANTILEMLTPLPGVSAANLAPDFTSVSRTGSGLGTIAPGRTTPGVTPTPHTFRLVIQSSGQVGAGSVAYEMDGNGVEVPIGSSIPASYALPGGTTVYFTNGSASPSFIQDDVYYFSAPGTPVLIQGRDKESDPALRQRCRNRWPSLSVIPTEGKYELWAKEASSQVTRVQVTPHATVAGRVDVRIAGQVNPLDVSVASAVQTYIKARDMVGDDIVVQAATTATVQVTGKVTVPVAIVTEAQTKAQQLWEAYVNGVDIGGVVRLSELEQALMDAGATDVSELAITGANAPAAQTVSPNVNLQLTAGQVAAVGTALITALSWYTI